MFPIKCVLYSRFQFSLSTGCSVAVLLVFQLHCGSPKSGSKPGRGEGRGGGEGRGRGGLGMRMCSCVVQQISVLFEQWVFRGYAVSVSSKNFPVGRASQKLHSPGYTGVQALCLSLVFEENKVFRMHNVQMELKSTVLWIGKLVARSVLPGHCLNGYGMPHSVIQALQVKC